VIAFLLAMMLRGKRKKKAELTGPAALAAGESSADRAALSAGGPEKGLAEQLADRDAQQKRSDAQMLSSLKLAPVITKKAEVLAKHLREKIGKEPEISAQILRTWIREEEI